MSRLQPAGIPGNLWVLGGCGFKSGIPGLGALIIPFHSAFLQKKRPKLLWIQQILLAGEEGTSQHSRLTIKNVHFGRLGRIGNLGEGTLLAGQIFPWIDFFSPFFFPEGAPRTAPSAGFSLPAWFQNFKVIFPCFFPSSAMERKPLAGQCWRKVKVSHPGGENFNHRLKKFKH